MSDARVAVRAGLSRTRPLCAATAGVVIMRLDAFTAFAAQFRTVSIVNMRTPSGRQLLVLTLFLCFLCESRGAAQSPGKWAVLGDTSGAPAGCSASNGLAAINLLIAGMDEADSAKLVQALAPDFVFSVIPTDPADTFFSARNVAVLLDYARERRRRRERIEIKAITFNGWRGQNLEFGPIYFLRFGDHVGIGPAGGAGKGTYRCAQGVLVFNLGRLAPGDSVRCESGPAPGIRR